jgi:nitronate monooxygenase
MDLRSRLSIEHPVLQAGMGAGIAGWELASAVSNAGGLGTVGYDDPVAFDDAIVRTKSQVAGKPYAANLLMPMLRAAHVSAVVRNRVPVVSMFYGFDRSVIRAVKESGAYVIYQIGSDSEAEHVVAAGADALIVQGHEAGGHVRGNEPLETILPRIRDRYPDMPVIASGGIWDRYSTARALAMGADGVSCGTRFLMTDESRAHDAYKKRLVEGGDTIVTTLFGFGWPAPHRVLINEAVRRWCNDRGEPVAGIRALNWLSQFGAKYIAGLITQRLVMAQRSTRPLFTPVPETTGMSKAPSDCLCDYAGKCVAEIKSIDQAQAVVRELAAGCCPLNSALQGDRDCAAAPELGR